MKHKHYILGGFALTAVVLLGFIAFFLMSPAPTLESMNNNVPRMFSTMKADGVDTNQDLLWGFFFVDSNRQRLEAAASDLGKQGYRTVQIRRVTEFPETYQLQVEKIEKHTVDSLVSRNREFWSFAERHNLLGYDGMDVGPPDGKSSFEFIKQKAQTHK